jgi:membrane protease YdiL (CAAX protease family)
MNDVTTPKPMLLRLAQFPPLRLVVFGAVMFYMLGYSNNFKGVTAGNPLLQIAVVIGWSAVGFAVYIGLVRLIERRPVTELSLPGMGRELGIGLLVGAGLYTACILILMIMGIYQIDGLNPVSYLLPAIALALSSGFFEELLFRGVLFRIVEEWLGSWISLVVSSLVFGLVHLMNPAATLMRPCFLRVVEKRLKDRSGVDVVGDAGGHVDQLRHGDGCDGVTCVWVPPDSSGRSTDDSRCVFFAAQPFCCQNGGTTWPRRTALTSSTTPVVVHSRKAMTEDSTPKVPPVSTAGPSMTGLMRPGSASVPETMPEKTPDWV